MATDFGQWERVASELRACRQAQRQAWGDIDNATLGRYLAGDVTPDERRRIEAALRERPELRKLTDLVSDVLRDCDAAPAPGPAVLPFRASAPAVRTTTRRWRQWTAVAAAACLLVGLAYTVLPRTAPPRYAAPAFTSMTAMRPPLDPADSERSPEFFAGKGDAPAAKTTLIFEPVTLACADGLCRAGETYQRHGDLDMAEFSYKLAYNIQEWKLGAEAPPTVETRRNLGEVYQTAYALAGDNPPAPAAVPAPPPTPAVAHFDKKAETEAQVRNTAAQLRDRIGRQPIRDVRQSVVPILVQNLREAKTPEDREQLGQALAELAPAARDALPALDACLSRAESPRERALVLQAKELLSKAEPRVGVRDGCGLFSLAAVKQGEEQIRNLALTCRVEVLAETRDDDAKDRARETDRTGVYFAIQPSPPAVVVYVGEALRGEGFDEARQAELRQVVEGPVSRKDFDAGLLAGVHFVARFEAEKAKKAGPDAPPKPE